MEFRSRLVTAQVQAACRPFFCKNKIGNSWLTNAAFHGILIDVDGALAQLVAHNTGSVGVRSSNLLCSTKPKKSEHHPDGGWVRISSFYLKYCGVINKMNERRRIGIIPIVPALKITIGQELTSTECERLPYFANGFMPFPASSSGSRSGTSPCGRRCRPIAAALRASPALPPCRPSAPRSDPRRKRCASDGQ